ncbi:MAG: triose-phosphate isomerase [Gammaproteobacteria bacterium]|nr:triose-phosphate isomerase [Gammaproteobacteria bacterium]MBT8109807.1 triose-phosphate isomerase [Gammaproteobacteria bacterium]NNL44509.1 triose-phosphate isomerase [Woeseiaceae bacterium]
MRDFLIAGNWKMNGSSAANEALLAGIVAGVPGGSGFSLLVCPPYPYIASVAARVAGSAVKVGAQNVSEHESGAYTGEVAPSMLADLGCEYVIVGHSERRAMYGESSFQVAAKFQAAQAAGIVPILCVGETLEEREAGTTESVVDYQLGAVLDAAGIAAFAKAVVAYEPVWAIGTGMTATPEQAQDVHRHIRAQLSKKDADIAAQVRILYGGSMKGENAAGLLAMPDIDGGLIGGASLKAKDFLAIAEAAARS